MIHCLLENAILNDSYALFGVFGDVLSPETDNCPPKIIQFSVYFIVPFHMRDIFFSQYSEFTPFRILGSNTVYQSFP